MTYARHLSYSWMKSGGSYDTFLVFCTAQCSFPADYPSFLPESPRPVVNQTVGDSEGAQTPWDAHEAACQKGVMKGLWRGVKVETSTRARPRSPPAHYVTSKKSSRRRTRFGISSLQQASPPVGHNRCFITPGDTPMHLFLALIAFAGVVGVLYGLVILLRGRSLSE